MIVLDVDDEEARRIALVDNKTSDDADYNLGLLVEHLTALEDTEREFAGTGFSDDEVADLRRRLAALEADPTDPAEEWVGMPDFHQPDRKSAHQVTIHFPTHDDADRFFALIERDRTRSMWWPASDGHVGSDTSVAYISD